MLFHRRRRPPLSYAFSPSSQDGPEEEGIEGEKEATSVLQSLSPSVSAVIWFGNHPLLSTSLRPRFLVQEFYFSCFFIFLKKTSASSKRRAKKYHLFKMHQKDRQLTTATCEIKKQVAPVSVYVFITRKEGLLSPPLHQPSPQTNIMKRWRKEEEREKKIFARKGKFPISVHMYLHSTYCTANTHGSNSSRRFCSAVPSSLLLLVFPAFLPPFCCGKHNQWRRRRRRAFSLPPPPSSSYDDLSGCFLPSFLSCLTLLAQCLSYPQTD